MAAVRVRFAPSPTGFLHIGGARTALYSWLWARKHDGAFVLRVEDTDRTRSSEASVNAIYESLRWLGLSWDEGPDVGGPHGPYLQSQRLDLYASYADRLVQSGAAFRCYATKEEIDAQRKAFTEAGGKGFRFQSPWREQQAELDRPHVVRLKAPAEGHTGWDDLIKGAVSYPNSQQQDFVLLRSDGLPLYNFGCVVDDLEMDIHLVARGDDHLVNTPVQLLLYQALGATPPQFAHVPLILGSKREKLSKRHAAVAVLDYRDKGFLPAAVNNYLARVGWSYGDQEVFTMEELIDKFDWAHVGVAGATYDLKKFEFVQAEHLRNTPDQEVATLAVPFCEARGYQVDDLDKLAQAIRYVKPRVTTLEDVAWHVDYFFRADETFEIEEKGKSKFLTSDRAPVLTSLATRVAEVDPFSSAELEAQVSAWAEANGLLMKEFAQAARVSLTGRTRSPGLFEVMEVLGKPSTLARLKRGASLAAAA